MSKGGGTHADDVEEVERLMKELGLLQPSPQRKADALRAMKKREKKKKRKARCKELKQAILAKHKDDEENDSQRSRSDQCYSMEKTAQGKGQEGRPRQQVSSLFSLCVNFLLAHIESCLSLRELEVPFLLDTMFWQLLYGSRLHLESLALLLHAGLSSAAFRDEKARTLDLTDEWLPMLRHGWALAELDLSGQRDITDNGMLSLLGTEPICLHCGMSNPLYVVEGLTTSTTQGVLSHHEGVEIPQQALVCGKKMRAVAA